MCQGFQFSVEKLPIAYSFMLLFQGKAFGFYCNCIFLCFIILQASLVRLACPEKQAKRLLNKQRLSEPQLNVELSSVFQNMQSNFSMTI